jgi:hypothetical protein
MKPTHRLTEHHNQQRQDAIKNKGPNFTHLQLISIHFMHLAELDG